jgi:hypothetical protein
VGKHPSEYDGIIEYGVIDVTSTGLVCHHIAILQQEPPEVIHYEGLQ